MRLLSVRILLKSLQNLNPYFVRFHLRKSKDSSKLSQLYSNRADYKCNFEDFIGSVEDYTKSYNLNTNNKKVLKERGISYFKIGKYDKASDDFIYITPFFMNDTINLAQIYEIYSLSKFYTKDYDGAIENINKYIQITRDESGAIFYRGLSIYLKSNFTIISKEDFEKAIMLDSNNSCLSSFSKIILGDTSGAFTTMKNRIKKNRTNKDQLNEDFKNISILYTLASNYEKAISYLDSALLYGYKDYVVIKHNPLFEPLWYKFSFRKLLDRYKIPFDIELSSASGLIKREIIKDIQKWQEKGEYETKDEFLKRMQKRGLKIKELTEKFVNIYKEEKLKQIDWKKFKCDKYDAESETFKISFNDIGDIIIKVNRSEAKVFKDNIFTIKLLKQDLTMQNDQWVISYLEFNNPVNQKSYIYDIKQQATYDPNLLITFNYDDIKISSSDISYDKTNTSSGSNVIAVGKSDVDTDIPITNSVKNNSYALIIGNEDYFSFQTELNSEINVDYAINDAIIFTEYIVKTIGVPDKQIKILKNATSSQMKNGLNWLNNLTQIDSNAEIIFYYSGHGLPDEKTKESYLIPVDVSASNLHDAIKLNYVYSKLTEHSPKRISVFLDACFSGGARNQSLLTTKGIKLIPKEDVISGNMIVLSSSTGEESSGIYREKKHGYMTYFLLKILKDTQGNISFKELSNYIINNVKKESTINGKIQTPQIRFSNRIKDVWMEWELK